MSEPFSSIAIAAFGLLGGVQQAAAAEASAEAAEAQSQAAAERERREGRRQLGRFRARVGASGLALEGAPLEALADAAAEIELAAQEALFEGEIRANQIRNRARVNLFDDITGAGTTLLRNLPSSESGS